MQQPISFLIMSFANRLALLRDPGNRETFYIPSDANSAHAQIEILYPILNRSLKMLQRSRYRSVFLKQFLAKFVSNPIVICKFNNIDVLVIIIQYHQVRSVVTSCDNRWIVKTKNVCIYM